MKSTAKTVTNEQLLDAIQALAQKQNELTKVVEQDRQDNAQNFQDLMMMTSEGFDKIDRNLADTNERMNGIEGETRLLKGEVKDLKSASYRHELQLAEFTRTQDRLNDLIHIDIKEIFTRLDVIEAKLPEISKEEIRKIQAELQEAVDWIAKVSKLNNIPIKFPS